VRRNLNHPNICALQWRPNEDEYDQPQQEVTVIQLGESKAEIDYFINYLVK
jgi:hypothetical protein